MGKNKNSKRMKGSGGEDTKVFNEKVQQLNLLMNKSLRSTIVSYNNYAILPSASTEMIIENIDKCQKELQNYSPDVELELAPEPTKQTNTEIYYFLERVYNLYMIEYKKLYDLYIQKSLAISSATSTVASTKEAPEVTELINQLEK